VTKITGSRLDLLVLLQNYTSDYNQYSSIADLHSLQFTVARALGFSVFASRPLAMDLNTETSTSNHMKSSCHFLVNYPGTSENN
jgi:hypothetical protein